MDRQERTTSVHLVAGTDRVTTQGSFPSGEDTVIDIVAKLLIVSAERRGLAPNKLVDRLSDQAMAELYRMARGADDRGIDAASAPPSVSARNRSATPGARAMTASVPSA